MSIKRKLLAVATGALMMATSGAALAQEKITIMDPTSGTFNPKFLELAKAKANGIIGASRFVASIKTPKAEKFVADYQKRYNIPPEKYAQAGYDVAHMVAIAVKNADSTDTAKVREALAKMGRDHSLAWCDMVIPSLGNRRPRTLVKTESGRRKVEALLAEFAEDQARHPENPSPMDLDLIRRELGLDRKI